jgi:hypothetical protein
MQGHKLSVKSPMLTRILCSNIFPKESVATRTDRELEINGEDNQKLLDRSKGN